MKSVLALVNTVAVLWQPSFAQNGPDGFRGDSAAIVEAEAMVETMGGMEIWSRLKSLHFVHEWFPAHRLDSYVENEILDLTGPRSWVEMKSEVYLRRCAYSPEHGYWNVINGEFSYASEESLANALERAPYSIYRIARAVAVGDASSSGAADLPMREDSRLC